MSLVSGSTRELTNARALDVAFVDLNGDQITSITAEAPPSSATLTSVAASTSSVTLLAANANRRKFIIYNNTGKNLFVAYAATASATAYTVLIAAHTTYESEIGDYAGVISGIWSGSDPNGAKITEITV